jgi:hypothetical protein
MKLTYATAVIRLISITGLAVHLCDCANEAADANAKNSTASPQIAVRVHTHPHQVQGKVRPSIPKKDAPYAITPAEHLRAKGFFTPPSQPINRN